MFRPLVKYSLQGNGPVIALINLHSFNLFGGSMKSALIFALSVVLFHTNAFTQTNLNIRIAECTLSSESLARIIESKTHKSETMSLLADFAIIGNKQDSGITYPAYIVQSAKQVGALSTEDQSTGAGTLLKGTITIEGSDLKTITFVSEPVIYNHKYSWQSTIVFENGTGVETTKNVKEGANNDNVPADTYTCKMLGK